MRSAGEEYGRRKEWEGNGQERRLQETVFTHSVSNISLRPHAGFTGTTSRHEAVKR